MDRPEEAPPADRDAALPEEGTRARPGVRRTAKAEMAGLIHALKGVPAVAESLHFVISRPRRAAWLGLSLAICVVFAVAGREADLPLRTWLALFATAFLVAGACVRIANGDDREEADDPPSPRSALLTTDQGPGDPDRDSQQGL